MNRRIILLLLVISTVTSLIAQQPRSTGAKLQSIWPGRQPDGSVLLPNLWSLRPAGAQIDLGDFPVNVAVHPDNRFAAVLHCGFGQNEIAVVDIPALKVVSRTKIDEAFYGLEFSHVGNRLYCSGAGSEVIHVFNFDDGQLKADREISLRDVKERGIPGGMAVSSDAKTLYVANVWGQDVAKVDLLARTNVLAIFLGNSKSAQTSQVSTNAADFDAAAITKRAEAQFDPTTPDAPFPYACRLDERRRRLYVSLWAQAAVAVVDLKSNRVVARWATGEHPNEMLLTKSGRYLYVANANRNTVTVFDTDKGQAIETLWAALYPSALTGSTPNSLALSPDEKLLFVANACNNDVAVFDVSLRGKSRSMGFIPVGWYPTSVRVTGDGKYLLVANGKGLTSKANPNGPTPNKRYTPGSLIEHIGGLMKGTLSVIDLPSREKFAEQLAAYTAAAYRCSPLQQDSSVGAPKPENNPVPFKVGDVGPIKYCIYVIKENRTYDQILGDLPQGNGEPKLCCFPKR
jgi:DNA-binding beta-propeller fold protein YncE